ncbi:MAG: hypothetical protein E6Q58_00555 [Niabella sp.]|nr:MAG: hypothetical protein E6Q58_00555 [Niabella sp.]
MLSVVTAMNIFHLFLDKKVEPKIKALKKFAKNNFTNLNLPNSRRNLCRIDDSVVLKQRQLFHSCGMDGLKNYFLNAIFSRPTTAVGKKFPF